MEKILVNLIKYYYCLIDPLTPKRYKRIIIGSIIYFIFPMDIIPDLMGPGGYTDDITVLVLSFLALKKFCKDIHKEKASRLISRMRGKKGIK